MNPPSPSRCAARFGLFAPLLLALACGRATSPSSSSSSHWLSCIDDAECAQLGQVAACGPEGYCVDENGERIAIDDPSSQVSVPPEEETPAPGSAASSARALEAGLPLLGACVESSLASPAAYGGPSELQFEGTVIAKGSGLPGPAEIGHCPLEGEDIQQFDAHFSMPTLAQLSWVRLQRGDGVEALVAVAVSGFAFPSNVGDELSLSMYTELIDFSPSRNWLEVRDASGGLVLWVGNAGSVAELTTPPELALEQGPVVAERTDNCIESWNEHRLDATLAGTTRSIAAGARAEVGEYHVMSGGVQVQTGVSLCDDAYVASARAAAWPATASVPLTAGIGGPCDPAFLAADGSVDPNLQCVRDAQFPLGYLTLACSDDGDCPAEATCDGALCRAPCSTDHECPYPSTCVAPGDRGLCQCGAPGGCP